MILKSLPIQSDFYAFGTYVPLPLLTDKCKFFLKNVKRSDMAILCNYCDNWIHVKCNNFAKVDYETLKSTADPWFCISYASNILPFCNRHGKVFLTIMNFSI